MRTRTAISVVGVATMALLACGGSTATEGHGSGGGSSGQGSSDSDSGVRGTGGGADASFPTGTYGMCTLTDEPSTLADGLGGVLVSSNQGQIVVRFVDGGAPGTLDFTQTSPTSANIVPSNQTWVGPWTECGGGVTSGGGIADPVPAVGTLDVESGMATFDGDTLFLTFAGTVEPADGGDCSSGPLSAAITCAKE